MHSFSSDHSRASPYPNSSRNDEQYKPTKQLGSADDVKEWEEARCPICMEHPHNAVLLKCSSHENGCRPYMCNTSYRHSNCLDQFCKSLAPYASTALLLQEISLTSSASRRRESGLQPEEARPCGSQLEQKLACPLCRGEIYGYSIVEPAREYMNSKGRSCSSETCDFSGTYSELRKHARSEHPSVRPSEVDPTRQRDWRRLERERDLEDVMSSIQWDYFGEESSEDSIISEGWNDWMSSFFEFMFRSLEASLMTRFWENLSSDREQLHDRRSGRMSWVDYDAEASESLSTDREQLHNRRSGRTSWVDYDAEASPVTGRNNNLSSESMSRLRQRSRWAPYDIGTSPATRRSNNLLSESNPPFHQRPHRPSEGTARFRSSESIPHFRSSDSIPHFRRMSGQSSESLPSFQRHSGRLPESMPRSRRLHWRGERWAPYNNQR